MKVSVRGFTGSRKPMESCEGYFKRKDIREGQCQGKVH